MRRSLAYTALAAALAFLTALPGAELRAWAQQQQPKKPTEPQGEFQITVEVPLVQVDVVVTTQHGDFIPGLKKENFRILEDGIPQTITNFAPTEAPITVVVLMEFSRILAGYSAYFAREWGYDFLNHLTKDDWAALITFDMRPRIEADFTKNKREIQEAVARLYFPGFSEANLFDALTDTLDRLKDVKGKKSILLLASGFDTFSKITLDDAIKRVRQTDVTVFSVGTARWFYERTNPSGAASVTFLQGENQLRTFAQMTGGRSWFPRFEGELPGIFREAAGMLRNQYSLAYTSSGNNKPVGKYRKIKVEVVAPDGSPISIVDQKGKKLKYVVYAKEGYLPSRGTVSD